MTAKIIPMGRDYRRNDYIAPRTLQEATGKRVKLEHTKLPKSWEDIAKIALATSIGFLLVVIGLSFI